jgi:predicted GNAT superfamily acetyltransferase
VVEAEEKVVNGRSGSVKLEIITGADMSKERKLLLVQIPWDFYFILRETDVEEERVRRIPLQWRLETRRVFQTLFKRGYKIIDFFHTKNEPRRNFYVLQKAGH